MADVLLKTKLFAPPARPSLVARPRLLKLLDTGLQPGCKLILVCAPPGFGKTTLVAAWIQELSGAAASAGAAQHPENGVQFSWLSLDENDNLPQRFFSYLAASMQAVFPDAGRQMLDLMALPRPFNAEELAASLANDLADVPGPYVMVLDDFHAIQESKLQEWLGYFVYALPRQVHLLLLTREDPRLRLNRLRARGQMVEVRLQDIRFTPAETVEFLNGVMGLNLAQAEIDALDAEVEGWPAGLQMAALSMQGLSETRSFIQNFSGTDRFILDYLVEQVLDRQPESIRWFLMKTSPLESMCAELCDAVLEEKLPHEDQAKPSPSTSSDQLTPSPSSRVILDTLEGANLFLIPLDHERRWYRYHHLFRDLLVLQLKLALPDSVRFIQTKAASWHDQNNLPRQALHYALLARNFDLAIQLAEKYSRQRWAQADTEFMNQVIEIPFKFIRHHPTLCLLRAWVLVIHGQVKEAERFLHEVEDRLVPYLNENRLAELSPAQRGMLGFALGVRAYINEFTHQKTDIHRWMPLILESVPESNVAYRNTMEVLIAILLLREGGFASAAPLFLAAAERDLAAGTSNAVCVAISGLARIQIIEGHLQEAFQVCSHYQRKIEERGAWRFYLSGDLKAVLADICRERNDLDQAGRLAQQAVVENLPWHIPHPLSRCYTTLARILIAEGNLVGAAEAAGKAEQAVHGTLLPPETSIDLDELNIRLWLAQGRLDSASRWASACEAQTGDDFSFRFELRHLCLARVWIALDRLDEAVAVLTRVAVESEASRRSGYLLQALVLLAAAYHKQNRSSLAEETLAKALRLAEPEDYVRLFIDEGQPIQALLAEFRRQAGRHPGLASQQLLIYVDRLLSTFLSTNPPTGEGAAAVAEIPGRKRAYRQPNAVYVEPLTAREQEILNLLAAGLTNQQITHQLDISLHTVKAHTSNIYQKFGVTNRAGAIQRGHELKLLKK